MFLIDSIPNDVLLLILLHLDLKSFVKCTRINKEWYRYIIAVLLNSNIM